MGCTSPFIIVSLKGGGGGAAPAMGAAPPRSVLRLVELTLDPGPYGARPFDLGETLVEHEFGDAGCRRDLRLEDIGLARKEHAFRPEARTDLVGGRLGRDDETFVGEPPRARRIGRQSNRREDVEVVGLTRME